MNSLFKTTYFRVSIFTLTAAAICILVLSSSVFIQAKDILIGQNDQAIVAQANSLALLPEDKIIESLNDKVNNDYRQNFYGGIFDEDGKKLAGNLQTRPSTGQRPGRPYRVRVEGLPNEIRMVSRTLTNGSVLYIGVDIRLISEIKLILFTATLVCLAFMALGAGTIGIGRSMRTVRDLKRIQEITAAISKGNFGERISSNTGNNEIDTLVKHVNIMMENIENLTAELASVNKNITHNLFSPLVRLRSIISDISNLTIISDDGHERDILNSAKYETDIIIKRFSALQRISSIESQSRYSGMSFFHLSDLKNDLEEMFEPYSADTGTEFTVLESDGYIYGDKGLLFEAIFNLVENAFKYCKEGSSISLIFSSSDNKTNIVVQDNGAGIPEGNLQGLLNRYSRGEAGCDVSGSGIGLSIVSSIARLHGFDLKIENVYPGLKVSLIAENKNFKPTYT